MKLRTAFVLSLLAVLGVMAMPALFSVGYVRSIRHHAAELRSHTAEAALLLGRVGVGIERLDRYQRAFIATGEPELGSRALTALDSLAADLERLGAMGYHEPVDAAAVPVPQLRDRTAEAVALMGADRREEATQLLREELAPLVADAGARAAGLAEAVDAATGAELVRVDRITRRAETTTSVALIGALLVALILVVLAARFLTRPLVRLSSSMARVADGQFEAPDDLPYDRPDEVGELLRAFRSMARQLSDLDRLKAEFLTMASRDLKTPVDVIGGYAALLEEELGSDLGERHREILRALRGQSANLSTRTDQLLEISRIRTAGLRLGLEEINLRHIVGELSRSRAAAADRHEIRLETRLDPSAPTFVIADPDCLRGEILGNLLDNALKYSPPGGTVSLTVSGRGGEAVFEIADQGPPIPAEALPHVFDRYFRGRDESGRTGAGLALPVARAGVEAHGGTIQVENPDDGGALFRIVLPLHPSMSTAASEGAA